MQRKILQRNVLEKIQKKKKGFERNFEEGFVGNLGAFSRRIKIIFEGLGREGGGGGYKRKINFSLSMEISGSLCFFCEI